MLHILYLRDQKTFLRMSQTHQFKKQYLKGQVILMWIILLSVPAEKAWDSPRAPGTIGLPGVNLEVLKTKKSGYFPGQCGSLASSMCQKVAG